MCKGPIRRRDCSGGEGWSSVEGRLALGDRGSWGGTEKTVSHCAVPGVEFAERGTCNEDASLGRLSAGLRFSGGLYSNSDDWSSVFGPRVGDEGWRSVDVFLGRGASC